MVTINGNTYGLTRTEVGNVLMMTKNGVPCMSVPDHLYEDFVQILSHGYAAAKFLSGEGDDELKTSILSATKTEKK